MEKFTFKEIRAFSVARRISNEIMDIRGMLYGLVSAAKDGSIPAAKIRREYVRHITRVAVLCKRQQAVAAKYFDGEPQKVYQTDNGNLYIWSLADFSDEQRFFEL